MSRYGTSGHGFTGMVFDLIILEVFPNCNDSMILFYDSIIFCCLL